MKEKIELNCENRKNKPDMSHKEWIEFQFDCRSDPKQYRDVLIHASLIESTIITESERFHPFPCLNEKGKYRTFGDAINLLKRVDEHKNEDFTSIEELKNKRNELVHDIIKKGLNRKDVESLRDELYKKIKEVYISEIFNTLFKNFDEAEKRGYGFLPKDKLSKFK